MGEMRSSGRDCCQAKAGGCSLWCLTQSHISGGDTERFQVGRLQVQVLFFEQSHGNDMMSGNCEI